MRHWIEAVIVEGLKRGFVVTPVGYMRFKK